MTIQDILEIMAQDKQLFDLDSEGRIRTRELRNCPIEHACRVVRGYYADFVYAAILLDISPEDWRVIIGAADNRLRTQAAQELRVKMLEALGLSPAVS